MASRMLVARVCCSPREIKRTLLWTLYRVGAMQ